MIIKCEFDFLASDGFQEGLGYKCIISSAVIKEREVIVSYVLGKHLEGKEDEDVEGLLIVADQVEYLPRGINWLFTNLKILHLKSGLKEITREDIAGFQNLTVLWLSEQKLVSLPSDLLVDLKKLEEISIFGNNLEFVDSKMFDHLKGQLIHLELGQYRKKQNTRVMLLYDQLDKKSLASIEDVMKLIDLTFRKPLQVDAKKFQLVFKDLWDSRQYSDFTIKVEKGLDKKEIKVHKAVLGPQNSFFAAMFDIDLKEKKSSEMTINDFSASSVEEFLQYLYTQNIPDKTNAMEIYELAEKYDIGKLKLEMEKIIVSNIYDSNSIEVLAFGNLHNSKHIVSAAFQRIKLANPEFNFANRLKFYPNDIRELIEGKRQRDLEMENVQKRFDELEKRLNFK